MLVSPTDAKEIALVFLECIGQEPNRYNMPRIIKDAKRLMEDGFTYEEIIFTIRKATSEKNVYSFGYILAVIGDVVEERRQEAQKDSQITKGKLVSEEMQKVQAITKESEVQLSDESTERNRRKAEQFGVQSRVRTKSYFDMFEGQ